MQYEPEPTTDLDPALDFTPQTREYIAYYVEDDHPRLADSIRSYHELPLSEVNVLLRAVYKHADRNYTTYTPAVIGLEAGRDYLARKKADIAARDHIREVGIDKFLDGEPTSRQPHGSVPDSRRDAAQAALFSYANDREGLAQAAAEYGIS